MRAFMYCLKTAAKNLWHEKWINLLTVLSIAVGLLILGTFVLLTMNMESSISRWSSGFGLAIYLKDDISADEERLLKDYFRNDPDVIEVKYMPKELALKDLQESLGPMNSVLAGFTDNPLPSSFELKLKGEALDPARISQKTFRLKGLAGVDDVQYGEKWLASLFTMTRGVKIVTGILSVVIFIAIAFVTYSTIKILFYRRIEEIETLKLLGATRGFIRLPFLLEGTFVGTAGGVMGLIGLSVIYSFTTSRIIEFLPSLRGMLIFFPSSTYLAAPLVGAVLSLAGSFLAIGKIKY